MCYSSSGLSNQYERVTVRRWLFARSDDTVEQKTILYAEDDEQVRNLVLILLTAKGYNVLVAEDGAQALAKALAFPGVITLLLSDVEMPNMTGVELAIQINATRPNIKVLLTSGLPSGLLVLNSGWQFLPKPFEGRMLMDRVRDAIGGDD